MGCCSSTEDTNGKRIVNIYYNGMKQPIAFYQGASRTELERLIKQCYKLPLDLNVEFMDENGIPLVLDGQIPDGESLFMKRAESQNSDESKPFIAKKNNSNVQSATQVRIMRNEEMKDSTPRITRDMMRWDENVNTEGIIDGHSWRTDGDWPFSCATLGGIDHVGGVYRYSIRFNSENDNFMYVYHHFGMIFKDEIGSLSSNPFVSSMPMFRFNECMKRNEGLFDIIVDVRSQHQVNYATHKRGIYFILKPENRCLAFTSLFCKQPSKEAVLLFAVWTKSQCKCVLQNTCVVHYGAGKIIADHLIENVAEEKNKHWSMSISRK